MSSTGPQCSVMCVCSLIVCVQQEQLEWDDVNKLLQHHGFKPVYFADPVENKNLSGKSHCFQFLSSQNINFFS